MVLPNPSLPFGLRNVRVSPIAADGTVGSSVNLPAAQTFTFKEVESYEILKGDDVSYASHGGGPTITWELSSGGISLAAYAVMMGGTVTLTGVTPNQIQTYTKGALDQRPYFQVEGQAISDSGGDLHCVVYRCKADGGSDAMMDNSKFWITKLTGSGFGNVVGTSPDLKLYQWIQNETVTPIV